MRNALELKNVSKKYDEFELDNISLTIPYGSIMGFIGENGAGKSTTIKLIMNLAHRDSGTITVLGQDSLQCGDDIKERIGVVLDECHFSETLTQRSVNQILKRIYTTWNEDVFNHYMKRFKLSEKKTIKEYSRGMKMKLSIATALSHNAQLLILDEPTSGLDPIVRDEILDVFLEFIQDEKHAMLISSHIVSDLEKICDYITFIHQGKILLSESNVDLMQRYGVLKCSNDELKKIKPEYIVGYRKNQFGVEALVYQDKIDKKLVVDRAKMEDIMLYYVKGERL